MIVVHNLFTSDEITLTRSDLVALRRGKTIGGAGLVIRGEARRPLLDRLAWPIMGALLVAGAAYFTLAALGQ